MQNHFCHFFCEWLTDRTQSNTNTIFSENKHVFSMCINTPHKMLFSPFPSPGRSIWWYFGNTLLKKKKKENIAQGKNRGPINYLSLKMRKCSKTFFRFLENKYFLSQGWSVLEDCRGQVIPQSRLVTILNCKQNFFLVFMTSAMLNKLYPPHVEYLTWQKIVHQITSLKTVHLQKPPTSEGGTSPLIHTSYCICNLGLKEHDNHQNNASIKFVCLLAATFRHPINSSSIYKQLLPNFAIQELA